MYLEHSEKGRCAYAKTHDKMFHVKHSGNRKTVYI